MSFFQQSGDVMRAICDGVVDIAKVHEATHRAGEVTYGRCPTKRSLMA